MLGLKQKLMLAFGGMLLLLATLGLSSSLLLMQYSATLDQIFRENYDSVLYAQNMKDAVDGLDDLAGTQPTPGEREALFQSFEENLHQEILNITLPGEKEATGQLEAAWKTYRAGAEARQDRATLATPRHEIKRFAQKVIDLNFANILSIDGQVKERTRFARRAMLIIVISGILLTLAFIALIGRSILKPLQTLTQSVHDIERGHLDLNIAVNSRDELGQLAAAFNAMAAKLREYRRMDRAKVFRAQKTTQLALNTFPDAVAIVGLDGRIELANEAARLQFNLIPDSDLSLASIQVLQDIFQNVCTTQRPSHGTGYKHAVQSFIKGREHFYLPQGVPILSEDRQLTGVTLVLSDVTDLRRLDEMKSDLISVASHELKTPLTSIRMSTHLLLEERLGPLNARQADLLVTTRDEAERLNSIIESLLDISRMESGRTLMELRPLAVEQLVLEEIERFATAYRERGVILRSAVEDELPSVLVDTSRIRHVFSNLLDNALKYTGSGGQVTLSAKKEADAVIFAVQDSGVGIPTEALARIFEKFYRVPDQAADIQGAGLGLAIAREIVEAHGGTISASSVIGEGSVFRFTLRSVNSDPQSPRPPEPDR